MKLYNPSFFLLAALVIFPQLSETIYVNRSVSERLSHYGVIGLLLGSSVFIGSLINSRLLKQLSPYTLNMGGSLVMLAATGLLVMVIPLAHAIPVNLMRSIFLLLVGITIIGMGIALPNCLSVALKDYREAAGSAGAIFGMMYYVMIGALLGIMSVIHNGTLWPMPIYFLLLSAGLVLGSMVLAKRSRNLAEA